MSLRGREAFAGVRDEFGPFLDALEADENRWWAVPRTGGLRTDEHMQQELAANAASDAGSLSETPHGRGAAVDLLALDAAGHVISSSEHPVYGHLAEIAAQFGMSTGRNFRIPDGGHVQLNNWRSLPFPPLGEGPSQDWTAGATSAGDEQMGAMNTAMVVVCLALLVLFALATGGRSPASAH